MKTENLKIGSSVYPNDSLSYSDWVKKYNVSTQYSDINDMRKDYHFDVSKFKPQEKTNMEKIVLGIYSFFRKCFFTLEFLVESFINYIKSKK
jgi:hypothetical protein